MKIRIPTSVAFCIAGAVAILFGDRIFGQVVILPNQRSFGYSGVISVPDSGSASLGGSGYSRSGSVGSGWGPYGPRAMGGSTSTSSASVSVQIIDLKAMEESMNAANTPKTNLPKNNSNDKAVAGQAPRSSPAAGAKKPAPESDVLKPKARNRSIYAPDPVMMKRFLNDSRMKTNPEKAYEDVRYYFTLGQEADALRRFESAGVYYRMAFEAMTLAMRDRYEQFASQHAQEDEKNKAALEANQKFRRSF